MKITAYKTINHKPDIFDDVDKLVERIDIELTDEEILRIGKRYFELASNPSLQMINDLKYGEE